MTTLWNACACRLKFGKNKSSKSCSVKAWGKILPPSTMRLASNSTKTSSESQISCSKSSMPLQKLKVAARLSHRIRCSSGDRPSRKCSRHPGRSINMPDRRNAQLARAKIASRYKTVKQTMLTKSCCCLTRHRRNRKNSTPTRLETSRRRMIFLANRLQFSNSWTRSRTLPVKT